MAKNRNSSLLMTSLLAMQAGLGGAEIIQARNVREPRMPLTDEEIEMLESFGDDKAGRKAKKLYVRELESKYREYTRAKSFGAGDRVVARALEAVRAYDSVGVGLSAGSTESVEAIQPAGPGEGGTAEGGAGV